MGLSSLERRYVNNDIILLLRLKKEINFNTPCTEEIFEYKSIHKFVIDELISELGKGEKTLEVAVEEYIRRMDKYSCEAPRNTRMIFSTAHDAAVWVLDSLLIEREED